MAKLSIDLEHGPEAPAGRDLFDQLVGAHMVARDAEELLLLVRHSLDEIHGSSAERSIRVMTHALYHAQALLVELLNLATQQQLSLEDAGLGPAFNEPSSAEFLDRRLAIWLETRDSGATSVG